MKQLLDHFSTYVSLDQDTLISLESYFEKVEFKKKEILLEAGKPCNYNYFVLSGCLHLFFIDKRGTERTVQFAIENWWLTDFLAYLNREPANFYIQAVENTKALRIYHKTQETLLTEFPKLERYFRMIYQISYGSSLMKNRYHFQYSKEEIYFHFTEQFPEFAQRVPQYLIASFLGLTPEYVSEIRKKRFS